MSPKKFRIEITLRKDDFSPSALDLGIWDDLIEGLNPATESVEISGERWAQ